MRSPKSSLALGIACHAASLAAGRSLFVVALGMHSMQGAMVLFVPFELHGVFYWRLMVYGHWVI